MLGKIVGRRRQGQQRIRWLDSITDLMDVMALMDVSLSKLWEIVKDREAWHGMGSQRVGHDRATEEQFLTTRRHTVRMKLALWTTE